MFLLQKVFTLHSVHLCGLNVTRSWIQGELNERALSKKSIIQVLGLEKKCGSDVQEDEVIMDIDVLSSQSSGKKEGKRGTEIQQSLTVQSPVHSSTKLTLFRQSQS